MKDCPDHQQTAGGASRTTSTMDHGGHEQKQLFGSNYNSPSTIDEQNKAQFDRTSDNEQEEVQARMGTKRTKGRQGQSKRFRAQLVLQEGWKQHIEQNWTLPLGLLAGLTKRPVFAQMLLGLQGVLGHTRKPKEQYGIIGADGPSGSHAMDMDEARAAQMWRNVATREGTIVPAKLNKQITAMRVILDPRSTHTLVDYTFARKKNLSLQKYDGPDIEMANGVYEKSKGQTAPTNVELARVEAVESMRCVESNASYDLLVGMDWLRMTSTTPDFKRGEYHLGGQINVKQVGKTIMGQTEDDANSEDELDEDLLATLSWL